MTTKLTAQTLVDILIAAHFAYKESRGREVKSLAYDFSRDGVVDVARFRESCGLCMFVSRTAPGGVGGDVYTMFKKVLIETYGDHQDPFSAIPDGGFFVRKINYGVRSREALKIAKIIEEKYL